MTKVIIYYQTLIDLSPLLNIKPLPITHIHLSSIHFGKNNDNTPYIHLNDYPPTDERFSKVWSQLSFASSLGVKIILMVGGAGGAFSLLFSEFETYYSLLKETIQKYPQIGGIDLDIEEYVDINNVIKLIQKIDQDFGKNFIISLAPIQQALEKNNPGLGGFSYWDLYNSTVGKRIDYFNGQFYINYDVESYQNVIKNGYPSKKVNMGTLSNQFNSQNFDDFLEIIKNIKKEYPNFGGVFIWEYFDAPPNKSEPFTWATRAYQILSENKFKKLNTN